MKRPLAAVGFVYLTAQIIAIFGGQTVSFALFFVLLAALILYLALIKKRSAAVIVIIASALVSFGLHSAYQLVCVRPAWMLEGRDVLITARVAEQPRNSDGYWQCFVRTQTVYSKDAPQRIKLKLSSSQPIEADVDDIIECRVSFSRSERSRSSVLWARAKGAVGVAHVTYGEEISVSRGHATLYGRIVRLRLALIDRIKHTFGGEYAPLLTGLLLGDTSYLDERVLRMFRACGLSHFLAVSGMHLSLLYHAADRTLTACRVPLRPRAAINAVFIAFFMTLAGFSASVTRAGIMLIMYCVARSLSRESDALNSLGASALIICLIRPYAAADAGFLMSVLCSLGIITAFSPLNAHFRSVINRHADPKIRKAALAICESAVTSLTASVAAFPVTSLYFGEMSVISLPCNMICVYPAFGFFLLGALSVVLSFVPFVGEILSILFYLPARLCASVLLWAVRMLSSPSWVTVNVSYRCMPAIMALCAAIFAAARIMFRGEDRQTRLNIARLCVILSLCTAVVGIGTECLQVHSSNEIRIFNVGDGIACCSRNGGHGMLLGAGGRSGSAAVITDGIAGMKLSPLDYMVLPEDSAAYMSNALDTVINLRPKYVWTRQNGTYSDRVQAECQTQKSRCVLIHDNQKWYSRKYKLGFETYTDSAGAIWYLLYSDRLTALIVPEGGDASLLPEDMTQPDVAVLRSEDIHDPTRLEAKLFVVCAGEKDAARIVNILRMRGIDNICSAAGSDMLRITPYKDGIKLEEVRRDARY